MNTDIVLESKRLRFESYARQHVADFFPLIKDNWELTQYMCWNPPSDIAETYKNFDDKLDKDRTHDYVIFCDNQIIGRIAIRDFRYDVTQKNLETVNIGYWVGTDFQNQGFGTEVIERIKIFCFETLKAKKITGECFADNKPSARVFAKTGFIHTSTKPNNIEKNGAFFDEECFECTKK